MLNTEDLISLFAIVFLFGAPVAAWIISRILAHQERMEMLRRGIAPPDPRAMRYAMRHGWQAGPVPPPPGVGMHMPPFPGVYDPGYFAQVQMRKGVTVTLVGLALLIGLSFIGMRGGMFIPGPWLLGGLIPMFVGIAQIINAVLNGARLPGITMGSAPPTGEPPTGATMGPPPSPGASAPSPGASPGSYAWRPGPTPEIEKPAPPPDAR